MENLTVQPRRLRKGPMASMISMSVSSLERRMRRRMVPYEKIGNIVLFDPDAVIAALKKYERKALDKSARKEVCT